MSNLKFNIPMYRFNGKKFLLADYHAFRQEIMTVLNEHEIDSMQSILAIKSVNNQEFEEEEIYIDCVSEIAKTLIQRYIELLIKYDGVFQHNFYVYEIDHVSHSVFVQNGKTQVI